MEDNFLFHRVEDTTRGSSSVLDLILNSREELVDNMKVLGNSRTSHGDMVEFRLLRKENEKVSWRNMLYFKRADFKRLGEGRVGPMSC